MEKQNKINKNKILYIVNFAKGGFYTVDKEIKGDLYMKVYEGMEEKEVIEQVEYMNSLLGRI